MANKQKLSFRDLILEGERLCKIGEYGSGVKCFEDAVLHGTDDLSTLSVIYNQLGNAYTCLGDLNKAVEYYQHDQVLTKSVGDLLGEAKACSSLCTTMKMLGNFEEAIICSQRHLDIAKELSNKTAEAQALYNMGNVYHVKAKQKCQPTTGLGLQEPAIQADLKIALLCYTQHLNIVREQGDRALQGRVFGSIGTTHYLLGNCEEAIQFLTERLSIAKEFGDKEAQRRAYTNLGNSYILLRDYEKAKQCYAQTLSISRQLDDRVVEAQACYSLGSTCTLLFDYQRAIEYHLRHKQIAQDLNDRRGMARACWLLSNAYASLGNYKKALEFTKQQLDLSTEIGDEAGIKTAQRNLRDFTTRCNNSDDDKPRVRRKSMENMQLLSLTPEQQKLASSSGRGTEVTRKLFARNLNGGSDVENRNLILETPYNGLGSGSDRITDHSSSSSSSVNPDKFFDLITRLQGRRMDDQRAEMRDDEVIDDNQQLNGVNDGNNVFAHNGFPVAVAGNREESEDSHEKMNFMISMLARSQSKRLNEQRVSLSSLPGMRVAEASNSLDNPPIPSSGVANQNRRDNSDIENNVFELDDNFLENLMRCQGTRLNDQRTAAPSLESFPTSTIPDEDFIALIVRMQSSRIDDQRCRFEPEGDP